MYKIAYNHICANFIIKNIRLHSLLSTIKNNIFVQNIK